MKKIAAITLVALLLTLAPTLVGCNPKSVDYSKTNDFEYTVSDYVVVDSENPDLVESAVAYVPKGCRPRYGLVFYVGTAINPSFYDFLASALARQGYIVVLPKVRLNMTYFFYNADGEDALERYGVKFFVGGHSQGGGAAVRRAEENADALAGVVLLAPLCYAHSAIDEEGHQYQHNDTLIGTGLPTLLLEAELDNVLTDDMKATTLKRIDPNKTEMHTLEGCTHMGFAGTEDFTTEITEEKLEYQKQLTIFYVLNFMNSVASI